MMKKKGKTMKEKDNENIMKKSEKNQWNIMKKRIKKTMKNY